MSGLKGMVKAFHSPLHDPQVAVLRADRIPYRTLALRLRAGPGVLARTAARR